MNDTTAKQCLLMVIVTASLTTIGCGPPTREQARDTAADTACMRFDECGRIGQGDDDNYATIDDCVIEQRDVFNDLLEPEECSDGEINEVQFDECIDRLETVSCDEDFGAALDVFRALDECDAEDMCEDPED